MAFTIEFCTCPHCKHHFGLRGCYNCKHYRPLSWKNEYGVYEEIAKGHCLKYRGNIKNAASLPCEGWEGYSTVRDAQRYYNAERE